MRTREAPRRGYPEAGEIETVSPVFAPIASDADELQRLRRRVTALEDRIAYLEAPLRRREGDK